VWKPWPDVSVRTRLESHGRCHLRFHEIDSGRELEAVEGGFSFAVWPAPGQPPSHIDALDAHIEALEDNSERRADLVTPMPNLNILYPQVTVPVLRGRIKKGKTIWVTKVSLYTIP
jgi:hypothetical protein